MRIISGKFKGRRLAAPEGEATRPTADRVREAVFNILEHAAWSEGLGGRRVLDLFAGSGALGFEALSRGSVFALFVDTSAEARGIIRSNAEALAVMGQTRIHRRDATDLGPRPAGLGEPFDLVFLDPPYRRGLGEKALSRLVEGGWLAPGAVIVFEHAADETPTVAGYTELDQRSHGPARVLFMRPA